jgi:hypothetical protein
MICILCRESGDERGEGLAVSGLGEVHYTMGEYNTALTFHQVNTGSQVIFYKSSLSVQYCTEQP